MFKFDRVIRNWTRSVWWRASQPQEVETILLESLPRELVNIYEPYELPQRSSVGTKK